MKGELSRQTEVKTGEKHAIVPVEKSNETGKTKGERHSDTLVYLKDHRKRRVDETIDTPDKYLSRYHYDSKNLDKCLELCPHCRKPNTYTYRKVVVDSALNYLEKKEEQRGRHVNRSMLLGVTAGLLVISAGVYYLLFHVLSGVGV